MGYIGKAHQSTSVPARTVSMLTGDGTTTTLTLSQEPLSASNVSVFFDGVCQMPGTDFTLSGSQLTFTSAPPLACVVCAIVGGGENISSPMDGSITAESIVAGAITNAKIASVAASKLTGAAFPALDASNVTFGVQQNLFTKSAADPEETSNVSLGTIWVNTLSGEIFVCVSDVNNQNSFMNVGTGTTSVLGNVTPGEPTDNVPDMVEETTVSHTFTGGTDTDGTVTHYHVDQISDANLLSVAAAEVASGSPHVFTTTSVSADTNVTFRVRTKDDEGAYSNGITVTVSVTVAPLVWQFQGRTHGYVVSGTNTKIQRYSFSTTTGGEDICDVGYAGAYGAHASNGQTYGFVAGGVNSAWSPNYANIRKFSWDSNATTSNVGVLTSARASGSSHSSEAYGFFASGDQDGADSHTVDQINHVNDGNSSGVGTMAGGQHTRRGCSSSTNGYSYRTYYATEIDTFSFASSGFTSSVAGYMFNDRGGMGTASSTAYGYSAGGHEPGVGGRVYIDKFSFVSGGTATDIGDLTSPQNNTSGQSSETNGFITGGYGGYKNILTWSFSNNVQSSFYGELAVNALLSGGTQH